MSQKPFLKTIEVLLVEDSWGDVVLMRDAFREKHLPVNLNIVTDGEDALAYLNREPKYVQHPKPDLILLDLNLPRMDGRAFLRRVKNHPRFKAIPVVVLTSSRLETDIREVFEMNADQYLVKPTDLKGFHETARQLWQLWQKHVAQKT